MAQRCQDARPTTRSCRHVEIGGDVQARTALERDLLDAVAGALDCPDDARVEGRAIERTSKHLPQFADDRLLPIEHCLARRDRVDDSLPSIARFVCNSYQVALEIA